MDLRKRKDFIQHYVEERYKSSRLDLDTLVKIRSNGEKSKNSVNGVSSTKEDIKIKTNIAKLSQMKFNYPINIQVYPNGDFVYLLFHLIL